MPASTRYSVQRKIADGGMAEIFLGTLSGEEGFERPIILKRILPALSADPQFRGMLVDEAHVAMTLTHGNIVQVLDLGRADDQFFLVLELVDGWDLATLFSRAEKTGHRLPTGLALYITAEVCRGLAYAHAKRHKGKPLQIIHRDICPQNVLCSVEGEVKITDFGIARAVGLSQGAHNNLGGVIAGHVTFMSPEQASAEDLDVRTDVYAAGAVLYMLTTGRHPIRADSEHDALACAQGGVFTPPEQVVPDMPPRVVAILNRAMQKSRAARYGSAAEMMAELEEVLHTDFKSPGQSALHAWLEELGRRDHVPPISQAPALPLRGDRPLPLGEDRTIVLDEIEVRFERDLLNPPSLAPAAGEVVTNALALDKTVLDRGSAPRLSPPLSTSTPAPAVRTSWTGVKVFLAVTLTAVVIAAYPPWRHAVMRKLSAAPPQGAVVKSSVRIVTVPEGAVVVRKGKVLGTTPFVMTAVVGTTHELTFTQSGRKSEVRKITVGAEPTTTTVVMDPQP
jgi:serine/threonine-protein kinase